MAEPARIYDPEDEDQAPLSRPDLRALEGGGDSGQRPTVNPYRLASPDEAPESSGGEGRPNLRVLQGGLADKEKAAEQPSFKYSPEDKSGEVFRNPFGNSRFRRGIAAGAIILTGGSIVSIVGFLSLTPLKSISMIAGLDDIFGAPAHYALTKETQAIENEYLRYVMRGLLASPRCHTSADANCVANIEGKDPVSRALISLKQGKAEQWLASRGIIIGKSGPNSIYLAINGQNALDDRAMKAIMNREIIDGKQANVFNRGTRYSLTDAQIAIMDKGYNDFTRSEKIVFRLYGIKGILRDKYGVRLCLGACKIPGVHTFSDTINGVRQSFAVASQAGKGWIIQRYIMPRSASYGLMLQCLLDPALCATTLEDPVPGDIERLTPFQRKLQTQIAEALANQTVDVAKIVQNAQDISKQGISATVVKAISRELASKFAGEAAGQTAGEVGAKAVPVAGWVLFAAQILHTLGHIGPQLRVMSYGITAAADMQMYAIFSIATSEAKSGHTVAAIQGSLANELSTNLQGIAKGAVDFTQTPLYGALFGTGFPANSPFRCSDGSKVPAGQYICPNQVLDRGNGFLTQLSSAVNIVPAIVPLADVLNKVNDLFGFAGEAAFNGLCATVFNPQCKNAEEAAAPKITEFSTALIAGLTNADISDNPSGGDIYIAAAGGADVFHNLRALNMGGAKLNPQQVADIRNDVLSQQKADFERQPMFARIFSTDTQFSLVSRLAVAMPASLPVLVADGLSSVASNPFGSIASIFSSTLAGNRAFAAHVLPDPFGVTQNGYLPDQIPDNPKEYWPQHCEGDYKTAFAARQVADDGGQAYVTTPEPCLLIDQAAVGVGGLHDPSMAPEGLMSADPPAEGQ